LARHHPSRVMCLEMGKGQAGTVSYEGNLRRIQEKLAAKFSARQALLRFEMILVSKILSGPEAMVTPCPIFGRFS